MEDWDEAKLMQVAHTKHDADDAARPNQTEIVRINIICFKYQ